MVVRDLFQEVIDIEMIIVLMKTYDDVLIVEENLVKV